MLTTGLLIGSAGGAIAAADTDSSGSTTQSQGADPAGQNVAGASSPTTGANYTPKHPIRTAVQDVLKKLRAFGQPVQRPVTTIKPTTVPVSIDLDANTPDPDAVTAAAADSAGSDFAGPPADSNPVPPVTNVAALDSTVPAPPNNMIAPTLEAFQPVTNAIGTFAGVAMSVPGVFAALPTSEDPVGDVITAMTNMLASVNDAVVPLAQVPGDLYSLLVGAAMGATTVVPATIGSGPGLSAAAGTGLRSATAPAGPHILPFSPFAGLPMLGDVTAPATLGGIAAAGFSADLSISGTAPLATGGTAPAGPLSFLENTVRAVLAPASLTALAAFALPGIGGLLVICAAGMRVGYRQAKAALTVRATGISRFARQGPLGVVRSSSLVVLHARHPRALRGVRSGGPRPASLVEQAA